MGMRGLIVRIALTGTVITLPSTGANDQRAQTPQEPNVYPCHAVAVYLWVNAVGRHHEWAALRRDPRVFRNEASLRQVLQWLSDLGVPAKVVEPGGGYWPPKQPAIALVTDESSRAGHYVFLRPIGDRYVQVADSQGFLAVLPADSLWEQWAGQKVWLIVQRPWTDRLRPWLGAVLCGAGLGLIAGWAVVRWRGAR